MFIIQLYNESTVFKVIWITLNHDNECVEFQILSIVR